MGQVPESAARGSQRTGNNINELPWEWPVNPCGHSEIPRGSSPSWKCQPQVTPKMPKRGRGRRQPRNFDQVHYPVFYRVTAGTEAETTIATIQEAFDRTRSFRIATVQLSFSAIKFPCFVQLQVYGPNSSSEAPWTSPVLQIPVGPVYRRRFKIPVTVTGWLPSGTVTTWPIIKISSICYDKSYIGVVVGEASLLIAMKPKEITATCPTFQIGVPSCSTSP